MKKSRLLDAVFAFLSIAVVTASNAAIVGTSNTVSLISPPPSLTPDALESDTEIFLFKEKQNFLLPSNDPVDISQPGSFTTEAQEFAIDLDGDAVPLPAPIPAGTSIDSYYLHFDAVSGAARETGFVTFDTKILGVMFTRRTLLDSATFITRVAGTTYSDNFLENYIISPMIGDLVTISADLLTLSFDFGVESESDNVRIITETNAVPIPASLWLFGSGLLGLTGVARRKKI